MAKEAIKRTEDLIAERNRFLTIAYNAIKFAGLDEQYSRETLLRELHCTGKEFDEIMEEC